MVAKQLRFDAAIHRVTEYIAIRFPPWSLSLSPWGVLAGTLFHAYGICESKCQTKCDLHPLDGKTKMTYIIFVTLCYRCFQCAVLLDAT